MNSKKKENSRLCGCIGKRIHDYGLGIGSILLGFATCIALWNSDKILDTVLIIQDQAKAKEIKAAVNHLEALIISNTSQAVFKEWSNLPDNEVSPELLKKNYPYSKRRA
ncbi:hypothetical protein [Candidatus Nucleicultrix amoebiphila]|jgi:hypothetical protein|uniref:Uncharacterized protein n=1 Tax=Candidatus Nucleicultrix amoebiphila FS5 TaxID=1414854 RepID=A0A1W6N3R6_9PROT|nr:hypothetical protein [Candidatus Nucleicultrix amoebiphila]ARN84411.1 hypothetical protein GQ61_02710 [Candidatus Nucleicultrix amoebiphila FS5]